MTQLAKPKWHMMILHEHDLDAAVKLYKALGFSEQFKLDKQWAELELDGVRLGLAYAEKEIPDRRTGIVLEVNDINAYCDLVKEHGCTMVNEPTDAPHGMIASFKDPGNTIIDLFQPMPEKLEELMKKMEQERCCKTDSDEDCCKKD